MSQSSGLARALNIEDLRAGARRRLPKLLFEFLDRGTDDDHGLRRNRAALDEVSLVPRVLRDVSALDTGASLFGHSYDMPVGISATGGASMFWRGGDVLLAKAARAANVPFMISGATMMSLEEISAAGGQLWYQHYPWRDRALAEETIDRAQHLGCSTLVATVDTAVPPFREYLVRMGFNIPVPFTPRIAVDVASRPAWLTRVYLPALAKGELPKPDPRRVVTGEDFSWEHVRALRRRWRGPFLLKGILSPHDARQAIDLGCDGVIVSNHGGRNLDCSIPAITALPRIVEAVGDRGVVLFDSGVRRGADVVKALALGAAFIFTGRAPLYGLSVAGQPGAEQALRILKRQIGHVMAYCGCASLTDIDADLIA